MLIQEEYLIIINSKNKIQTIRLQLDQNPFTKTYKIFRITGQYGGKETDRPVITIDNGKVKRTTAEQAALQYNALLKNYLDKGYVKLSGLTKKKYTELSEQQMKDLLGGDFVSDQHGVPKPMLAKSADKCAASVWDKELYVSRKIDGVRCLMYYRDGIVQTASRGGGSYNPATKHLREDPTLLEIFRQSPDLILDGEIYKHSPDWPLQRISGVARLKKWNEECNNLEYWIYDYVSDQPFSERKKVLDGMKSLFPTDSKIKIVEHELVTGYTDIKKKHDQYVKEGFEGLCARNPKKEYGINKRSALYLIKLKEYKDAEFEITGVKEGLRDEDMCFTLKTKDGKEFSAKPMGATSERVYYIKHPEEYIGKMATCKYFNYSKDGIPTQPILVHIRPEDE